MADAPTRPSSNAWRINGLPRRITVLLTGVGGGGHGEQILKALRLARLDLEIVGTDITPFSSGLALVDHPYLVPKASEPDYIPALMRLCGKHGVQAMFHGSEPELKVMAAHRGEIEDRGIFLPINPDAVIDICMDKVKTAAFLQGRGFGHPRYAEITGCEQLKDFPIYPAVLKPSVGGGGSAMTGVAQSPEEAVYLGRQLLDIFGRFIIQEYVGTPDDEYTVGVLTDMDGRLINSIALRRYLMSALSNRFKIPNRTPRKELGPVLVISSGISQGYIGHHAEVQRQCEEIALALGARGAINIQCRFVGGRVIPFEINPRFSGTTSLRAMVGYNEPEILLRRHVLKEEIEPHFPYDSGTVTRSLAESLQRDSEHPSLAQA